MPGAFPQLPDTWKEYYGSATFPELLELYNQQLQAKQNSRLIMKKSEVQWESRHPQSRSASLVDSRNGFANSVFNVGLSEIDPGSHTGRHKHIEAVVHILQGRGYSVIGDQRVDWEEGDTLYVPPDVYHQHFNLDSQKKVVYLRILPAPLLINLLALLAAVNVSPAYNLDQAEARPGYRGDFQQAQEQLRGEGKRAKITSGLSR